MSHNVYRLAPRSGSGCGDKQDPSVRMSPTPLNNNNIVKSSPCEKRERHNSGSVLRHPSILKGLKNLMRPRAESLGSPVVINKALRKVQIHGCALESVYDLRECAEDGSDDLYDDDHAFRRPRSNSSDFLILRKTSRPLSVDVVGLVDAQSDPYRQYMSVVDCYELAPASGHVIVLDKNIKISKGFAALREHNIGAGLIWDSEKSQVTSIVTLTDFLMKMSSSQPSSSEDSLGSLLEGGQLVKIRADTNRPLLTITAKTKILDACEEFVANKVHRIVVTEPGTEDVMYLLTLKRVLQAIHKQNRSLHFAQWLRRSIRDSAVGKWNHGINTVGESSPLSEAVNIMLGFRLSSLPVVDKNGRPVDVLSKTDIAEAMWRKGTEGEGEAVESLWQSSVGEVVSYSAPRQFFVRETAPVSEVLDQLLSQPNCRCVFVTDSTGKPIASVSLSDIVAHLVYDKQPFA